MPRSAGWAPPAAAPTARRSPSGATQSPHGFALAETYGRSTVGGAISASSYTQYALAASHAALGGFVAGQGSYQVSDADGRATVMGGELNFTRTLNQRSDIGFRAGLQRVDSAGQVATIRTIGATLTRHLSRSLALRIDTARTAQTGPGGGVGSSLDVELVGPLSFGGAARYSGRANPNLPAIVQGRIIYQDIGLNASGGPLSSRGVAGVIVVLDGIQTQRTDSDGSYQFRFVKPGEHSVALQDGTIPLGLVAERDARQFTVQGGQIVVTDFLVGQYGGIRGQVTSGTAGGEAAPLAGVAILVDGTQRVFTGADGSFQLGKLATGAHTVQLMNDSLPASAQIAGEATRTVQVRQGALTAIDFTTLRLGSIRGTVFDGDPLKGSGAPDIYVVAQPGDHAAITGADGTFIIDNLTPGNYTLAIDPQTLPDGAAVQSGDGQAKDVGPGEDVADLVFSVGAAQKDVVFDFSDKKRAALQLTLDPVRVPPLGAVELRLATSAPRDAKIEATVGLSKIALHPVSNGVFSGQLIVPAGAPAGDVPVHVEVGGAAKGATDAVFTVDPKVPLVSVRIQDTRVIPGQTVHGVLKTYADVRAGDAIVFGDGQDVRLPEPHGRVFGFNVRIGQSGSPHARHADHAGRGASGDRHRPTSWRRRLKKMIAAVDSPIRALCFSRKGCDSETDSSHRRRRNRGRDDGIASERRLDVYVRLGQAPVERAADRDAQRPHQLQRGGRVRRRFEHAVRQRRGRLHQPGLGRDRPQHELRHAGRQPDRGRVVHVQERGRDAAHHQRQVPGQRVPGHDDRSAGRHRLLRVSQRPGLRRPRLGGRDPVDPRGGSRHGDLHRGHHLGVRGRRLLRRDRLGHRLEHRRGADPAERRLHR